MADLFRPAATLATGADSVLIDCAVAGWDYAGLQVFRLAPGESRLFQLEGVEAALLPLTGEAKVDIDQVSFSLAGRSDLFRERTDFAFAPLEDAGDLGGARHATD